MADGQLSRPLSPRLHADPRHARRPRLRCEMGRAHEGHGTNGLDHRPPLRDRLRQAWAEQAALETDDGSFCAAETERRSAQPVLIGKWKRRSMSMELPAPVPRLTVITLGVSDIRASIAFYDALG